MSDTHYRCRKCQTRTMRLLPWCPACCAPDSLEPRPGPLVPPDPELPPAA